MELPDGDLAFGDVRMTPDEAAMVQMHMGFEPEQLTDEELRSAMDELGMGSE